MKELTRIDLFYKEHQQQRTFLNHSLRRRFVTDCHDVDNGLSGNQPLNWTVAYKVFRNLERRHTDDVLSSSNKTGMNGAE